MIEVFDRPSIIHHQASDHLKFEKAISAKVLTHYEFERNYPRYPRLDRISLTKEEEDMWIDLSPYAGLPFAVPTVSSLRCIYCWSDLQFGIRGGGGGGV